MKSIQQAAKILSQAITDDSKSLYSCLIFGSNKKKPLQAIEEINQSLDNKSATLESLFSLINKYYPVLPQCLCEAIVEAAESYKQVEILCQKTTKASDHANPYHLREAIIDESSEARATRFVANKIVHHSVQKLKQAAAQA